MNVKRLVVWLLASTAPGCASDFGGPAPPATEFVVTLTGEDVVPPVATTASGTVQLRLHFAAVQYTIRVENLASADSARLYLGAVQTNGPAVMNLCAPCTATGGVLANGMTIEPLSGRSYEEIVRAMRGFGAYVLLRDSLGPSCGGRCGSYLPEAWALHYYSAARP